MNEHITPAPEAPGARPDWSTRALSRRAMLRAGGAGGLALALAACAEGTITAAPTTPKRDIAGPGGVVLDFSNDVGVLNYAYALEQLEAAFYAQVVTTAGFSTRFAANEQRVLLDLRDHELVHREFLKTALGSAAIPGLTPNFSSIDFTSRTNVLTVAQAFEDLGVGAYNGAAHYIHDAGYLTVAGKIVSVEARHASAIRDLLTPRSGNFAPATFDSAFTPTFVLSQAGPYIVDSISVINS
jgi:rubrerythrin